MVVSGRPQQGGLTGDGMTTAGCLLFHRAGDWMSQFLYQRLLPPRYFLSFRLVPVSGRPGRKIDIAAQYEAQVSNRNESEQMI